MERAGRQGGREDVVGEICNNTTGDSLYRFTPRGLRSSRCSDI
jgi:hypothetical protein